jgi:protein-S-isoprenylcysteine O-methyltransferase Ste14
MYLVLNLVMFIFVGLVPAVVLCALAGRWDVWNVWATAGVFVAWLTFQTLAEYRISPAILKDRMKLGSGGRVRWTTARAYVALIVPQWIIAGLDHRFHWSDMLPLAVVVAGVVIFAIGWGLATWSALVNPFFSPEVRIQADRGQRVIHEGPYALIRHPGYATILLSMVAAGLALDSLLSIIPALVYAVVTIRVTAIEDRMLREELAGYSDYAAKVRYRLVPGLW